MRETFFIFLIIFTFAFKVHAQADVTASEFKGYEWTGFCYPVHADAFPDGYGECVYQFVQTFEMLFNSQDGYCHFESPYLSYLKKINRIKIENNFVVDGDRYVQALLRKYVGACAVLALNDTESSEDFDILGNGLHFIYTQYAEDDSWPMPTKELQRIWAAKFGNTPDFTKEQRLFLFNEWHQYLKHHIGTEKRWLPKNPQFE